MPVKLPPCPEEAFSDPLVAYVVNRINDGTGVNIDVSDGNSRAKYAPHIRRIYEACLKARSDVRLDEYAEVSLPFLMPDCNGDIINFETVLTRKEVESISAPVSLTLQTSISVRRPLKLKMPG